jgi:hypothetical protein
MPSYYDETVETTESKAVSQRQQRKQQQKRKRKFRNAKPIEGILCIPTKSRPPLWENSNHDLHRDEDEDEQQEGVEPSLSFEHEPQDDDDGDDVDLLLFGGSLVDNRSSCSLQQEADEPAREVGNDNGIAAALVGPSSSYRQATLDDDCSASSLVPGGSAASKDEQESGNDTSIQHFNKKALHNDTSAIVPPQLCNTRTRAQQQLDGEEGLSSSSSSILSPIISETLCDPSLAIEPKPTTQKYCDDLGYEEGLRAIADLVHNESHGVAASGLENDEDESCNHSMKPPAPFDERLLKTKDSKVLWSYDPQYRVVRADFTNVTGGPPPCCLADLAKMAYLMQRDDLTVISKGLTMQLHDTTELHNFLSYLESDDRKYHKFRRYHRQQRHNWPNRETFDTMFVEIDGHVEMTPREFVKYLRMRMQCDDHHDNDTSGTVEFQVNGKRTVERVQDVLLYMVDADIPQLYPQLDQEYRSQCHWPSILPGGALCMMGEV